MDGEDIIASNNDALDAAVSTFFVGIRRETSANGIPIGYAGCVSIHPPYS